MTTIKIPSLKATPKADIQAKARKAGVKAKKPSKKGASKSERSAASFATRWNTWVDKINEGAKRYDERIKGKQALKNFGQKVAGL